MRRIFKVSFYIRGNHVNKDGTCAVMIRLSLDGERISAGTTGISIKPELWDGQRQQLKGRNTEVVQTNKKLGGIRDELLAIAEKLEFEGSLALDRVKAVFLGVDEDYDTIGKLFDKYIKNVKQLDIRQILSVTVDSVKYGIASTEGNIKTGNVIVTLIALNTGEDAYPKILHGASLNDYDGNIYQCLEDSMSVGGLSNYEVLRKNINTKILLKFTNVSANARISNLSFYGGGGTTLFCLRDIKIDWK